MNSDEILKILDELSQRLTPAAEYAFDIVASRVVAEGLIGTVVALVFIGIVLVANIVVARLALRSIKEVKEYNNNTDGYLRKDNDFTYFGWSIFGVITVSLSFFALSFLYESVLTLFSIEYSTLIRIVEAAGHIT